jgi:hypothetical protein
MKGRPAAHLPKIQIPSISPYLAFKYKLSTLPKIKSSSSSFSLDTRSEMFVILMVLVVCSPLILGKAKREKAHGNAACFTMELDHLLGSIEIKQVENLKQVEYSCSCQICHERVNIINYFQVQDDYYHAECFLYN